MHHCIEICVYLGSPFVSFWAKALYPVLSSMRGTGPVESIFQYQQLRSSGRHAGHGQTLVCAKVKIRVDGPSANDFCKFEAGKYSPGPLCVLAQHMYAAMFGSKCFSTSVKKGETDQRRHYRTFGSTPGHKEASLPHYLVKQAAQRHQSGTATEEDGALTHAAIANARRFQSSAAAQDRIIMAKGEVQEKCLEKSAEMLGSPTDDTLKKLKKHQEEVKAKAQQAHVRICLAQSSGRKEFPASDCEVFVMSKPLKQLAVHIFPKERIHPYDKEGARMVATSSLKKIWVVSGCASQEVKKALVLSGRGDDKSDSFFPLLCARLFGGYLADEEWLRSHLEDCPAEEGGRKVVQPIVYCIISYVSHGSILVICSCYQGGRFVVRIPLQGNAPVHFREYAAMPKVGADGASHDPHTSF